MVVLLSRGWDPPSISITISTYIQARAHPKIIPKASILPILMISVTWRNQSVMAHIPIHLSKKIYKTIHINIHSIILMEEPATVYKESNLNLLIDLFCKPTTMEEEEAFSKMHITRMLAQLAEDTYRTFEKGWIHLIR